MILIFTSTIHAIRKEHAPNKEHQIHWHTVPQMTGVKRSFLFWRLTFKNNKVIWHGDMDDEETNQSFCQNSAKTHPQQPHGTEGHGKQPLSAPNGVGFAVVTSYYPWRPTYKSDRRIAALELRELPSPWKTKIFRWCTRSPQAAKGKDLQPYCENWWSRSPEPIHRCTCFVLRDSCFSHFLSVKIAIACTFLSVSCFTYHHCSARFSKRQFGAVKQTMMR